MASRRKKRNDAKSAKARLIKNGEPLSREQVLDFVTKNPTKANKRDIARAFGIKGDARIALKSILNQLREDGLLEKNKSQLKPPNELPPVCVLDILTRNRDGELLALPVQWNEQKQGKAPAVQIRPQKGSGNKIAGIGARVLARVERSETGVEYTGRVMKILPREKSTILGVLREDQGGYRLEPANRRQKEVEITKDQAGEGKDGDLVEVEVGKSAKYGLKRGKVVQVIGAYGTEKAISMIAIHENDIPHIFPDAVISEAENAKPVELGKREDWREVPLITIDPADAKDHDDAIYAIENPDSPGGYIVTVAIADVSHYIRAGSQLDKEALKRGNSVYFPDRVVPMLPERISNELCSLKQGVDRPALAVRMIFESDGRKRSHTFHRILMRNPAKISYQEAQAAIDGNPGETASEILDDVLRPLWDAYACLKRGRDNRQPLELELPERKILLKKDGSVDRVITPPRLDAHKLVEEYMIQANVAAAETLEQKKQALIYRIHDTPSLAKQESLRDFLKTLNLNLVRAGNLRPSHFNGILSQVEHNEHRDLVNQVVLRSQSQAQYSPDNIGHFGLNLRRYAHFTSPIRRYADLIVHRALIACLGLGEGGLTREEEAILDVIAADISITERKAVQAERNTVDRLISTFLSEKIGERFYGRIAGVTKAGLFVTLNDTGADGFVPISSISNEYLFYDATSHSLIAEKSGEAWQLGQNVEIKLLEAAPVAGALRFEMLSDGEIPSGLRRSKRTNIKPESRGRRGKTGNSKFRGRR